MIRSRDIIFNCPNCGKHYITYDVMSSGGFGARIYTDGRAIGGMTANLPIITKCDQCELIFWIRDFDNYQILNIAENLDDSDSSSNASYPRFLNIYDNFKILENGFIKGMEQEFYIRKQIWWKFNDRIRANETIFQNENDEQLWLDNLNKLKKLTLKLRSDDLIMLAEINRNLGDFEACKKNAKMYYPWEDLNPVLEQIIKESDKQNKYVVEVIFR